MYILNKEKLKEEFKDYFDLTNALGYEDNTTFSKPDCNILDDDKILCPDRLRKRFDQNGYSYLYYTIDEKIFINAMIYGKFVLINDVMRVVVGLMLDGFTRKPPKVYWTAEELVEASTEYKIYGKSVEKLFASEEAKHYFKEQDGKYSLNVKALTQSCQ